ncbi:MAG: alpha/beta hydrolase [Rhizobiales bacterium]|nr:alpha/beta hydrolase [Hyphomicrobiales bacterium]
MSSDLISEIVIAGFPAHLTEVRKGRPPLVYIHGAFVDHQPFDGWLGELARLGWGGVSASRSGRLGIGPASAQGLTINDYVADTLKVIDTLDEAPVLVGHSLGGLIAQKLAERGKCRAAILLAPAPAGMLTAQPVALPSYLPMLPSIMAGRPFLPPPGTCSRIVLNRVPKDYHAAIHGGLVHESGKVYREMMFGAVKVDPAKVKCPMLVIGGEDDRIVSPALVRWTARRYGADLRLYAGHAHLLIGEPGWEKIATGAVAWLEAQVAGNVTKLRAA